MVEYLIDTLNGMDPLEHSTELGYQALSEVMKNRYTRAKRIKAYSDILHKLYDTYSRVEQLKHARCWGGILNQISSMLKDPEDRQIVKAEATYWVKKVSELEESASKLEDYRTKSEKKALNHNSSTPDNIRRNI